MLITLLSLREDARRDWSEGKRKGMGEREEKGEKEVRKQDEQKRIGPKKEVKTERRRLPSRGEES